MVAIQDNASLSESVKTNKKTYDVPDTLYNILNNEGRQLVNYTCRPGGEW